MYLEMFRNCFIFTHRQEWASIRKNVTSTWNRECMQHPSSNANCVMLSMYICKAMSTILEGAYVKHCSSNVANNPQQMRNSQQIEYTECLHEKPNHIPETESTNENSQREITPVTQFVNFPHGLTTSQSWAESMVYASEFLHTSVLGKLSHFTHYSHNCGKNNSTIGS